MPVKVLPGTNVQLTDGIYYAVDNGADVINMSLGFPGFTGTLTDVDDALQYAIDHNVTVIAASGNEGNTTVSYPAINPNVIAVGATDYYEDVAYYTNQGDDLELSAPGGVVSQDLTSDGYGGSGGVLQQTILLNPDGSAASTTDFGWYYFEGTSMASPHVAAVAALVKEADPRLTPSEIRTILRNSAEDHGDPGWDSAYGYGIVNAYQAVVDAKTFNCNQTKALTAGQWNMVAMACAPGGSTVGDLFPGLSVADNGVTWGLFERDAATEQYVLKGVTDTLESGKGYWFYSGTGVSLSLYGGYNTPAEIPLVAASDGRMNLVGNFLAESMEWNATKVIDGGSVLTLAEADPDLGGGTGLACDQRPIDASCVMSRKMYLWNGSAYQVYDGYTPGAQGMLNAFDALWVEAYKPGITLWLSPTAPAAPAAAAFEPMQTSQSAEPAVATSYTDMTERRPALRINKLRTVAKQRPGVEGGKEWHVRLTVESGAYSDPGNVLGQLHDSRDGQDIHDLNEKEPYGDAYLTIVFPHEDFKGEAWGYTTDFHAVTRRAHGVWRFTVKASDDITHATLKWQGAADILRRSRIVDMESGQRVRLKEDGSFDFTISGGQHDFIFRVR